MAVILQITLYVVLNKRPKSIQRKKQKWKRETESDVRGILFEIRIELFKTYRSLEYTRVPLFYVTPGNRVCLCHLMNTITTTYCNGARF